MNGFTRAKKLLTKYDELRGDPTDHIYNIARVMAEVVLNEEECVNFYAYICEPDKAGFEYKHRSEYTTLGDLGEDELERLHNEVYDTNEFNQITHAYPPNGNEINLVVSNIKDDGIESVASSCEEIQIKCSGQEDVIKTSFESSCENIQKGWDSSDDEKKAS